jgi:hypothetical protein
MSHDQAQSEPSHELAGFGLGVQRGRARSASPNIRITARARSGIRRDSPDRPGTPDTSEGTPIPTTQPLRGGIAVHPTLMETINSYSGGGVSYVRAKRRGEAYLKGLATLTDLERDGLSLEFSETVDRTIRRRDELENERRGRNEGRRGGGEERRGEARDEEEVGGSNWGEDRRGDGTRRGGRIREDRCPWYKAEESGGESLTENQRKTGDILRYLQEDINLATHLVRSARGSPKHFPDSEWANIVTTLTSLTQVATKGKDLRARRE